MVKKEWTGRNNMQKEEKNKKIHIEFLRILAMFLVLFNHTETKGFTLYTLEQGTLLHWFYLTLSIFVKVAVPIFFMISGALLLPKEESIKELYQKRVLKIVLVLTGCHFVNYIYFLGRKISLFSLSHFLERVYTGKGVLALWFLYAYLAFLVMLPFLRKLVKNMKEKDYHYMIILFLIIQIVYVMEYLLWQGEVSYNESFSLFITSTIVFYPLLGHYIENCQTQAADAKSVIKKLLFLSVIVILITGVLTQYRCYMVGEWEENSSQKFFECFIFIPAITVYLASKQFFDTHSVNKIVKRGIEIAGTCSFGVYLFEYIYRVRTEKIFHFLSRFLPVLPACLIWIFCACSMGVIITYVLKKIPLVRKFI